MKCLKKSSAYWRGAGSRAGSRPCSLPKIKATRKRFANENELARRCRTIGFEEGVIIRSTLGRMIMAPALIAGHSELDELVEKNQACR